MCFFVDLVRGHSPHEGLRDSLPLSRIIDIQTLEMLEGDLPPKALSLVREWMEQYKMDLLEIWNTQNFKPLPPLE
jgi:hypothetical protein